MSEFEGTDFYALEELLSTDDREYRNRVREWVSVRILPIVAEHFRNGTFPHDLIPEMSELGAFGGTIVGYGCPGFSNLRYGLLMQELERGDSGLRTFASVQGSLAMYAIYLFGSEEQKRQWLPAMAKGEKLGAFGLTEPDHGSNPGGLETEARKTDGGYVLNGVKTWIGNGSLADLAIIWARLVGVPRIDSSTPKAIRGFLVKKGTPGVSAEDIQGKLSLRMSVTSKLSFDNCELPEDALLSKTDGLKSPLTCLNQARDGIAWGAVGAAMACYEEARSFSAERIQFGKPIGSFQLVQQKLAIMLTELTKAQLMVYRLAQLKDSGRARHYHTSMAKMNNVATALDIARTARDILGAVGILDERQSFRHMCNLESVKTYEGTHDIHQLILGKHITGIGAFQ